MSDQSHSKSNNETDFQRLNSNKGALVNTNNEALSQYKKTKKRFEQLNKVSALEDRMTNIENLLMKVLEKLNDSNDPTG